MLNKKYFEIKVYCHLISNMKLLHSVNDLLSFGFALFNILYNLLYRSIVIKVFELIKYITHYVRRESCLTVIMTQYFMEI